MEKIGKEKLLEVKKLRFSYGDKHVLKKLSFHLDAGEVLAIIGESGSGKTSLLKLIAGLLSSESGDIFFKGNKVLGPSDMLIPGHKAIKLVNQDFDLMPYLSVSENILRDNLWLSESARKRLLGHYQRNLKLSDIAKRQALKTSGGQKQRVALATALASRPPVLLLDEPFSNIDFPLKRFIMHKIKSDWKSNGVILVAHEPSDVLSMADRILVLNKGRVEQIGNTDEIYQSPKNRYVAELLGQINHIKKEEASLFNIETEKDLWIRPDRFVLSDDGIALEKISLDYYGGYQIFRGRSGKLSEVIKVQLPSNLRVGGEIKVVLDP